MNHHGLGRGMAAFFPEEEKLEIEVVEEIALDQLRPNPYQPRKVFDEAALDELAQSIEKNGIFQPILVRKSSVFGYEIIAGERRFRASQKLKKETVPCIVRQLADEEMMQIAVLENLQREDLTPLEEAQSYDTLMKQLNITQEQLAQRLGKSRSYIANYLRLLSLPPAIQEMVTNKELAVGKARAVLGLKSEKEQLAFAKKIIAEQWNAREVEQHLKEWQEKALSKKQKEQKARSIYEEKIENELRHKFQIPVELKRKGKKVELLFADDSDFATFLDQLEIGEGG
ncbi:ParB/RepB/Spo0J family partition protein [Catellicoccus marimammalium]|uniref:Chromosome or plasmid partitioning protein ParB / stage 0 sporulation protein J n=1 Tax=Catellicoccus marimammalium M35/04/3 TaxID=1234409 RepID=K8Z833_9ENTE|nr:ParB/RepB/Spo0J family partition protein [Catellicoccus marimammalium]EKU27169.1 chromosome or plasmid partitioning protein ParB / stage 0 sporulation protein J [Catellicoccus marimammalium M35/04/3]